MKLKGIVQVRKLHRDTLEVLDTFEQENTITIRGRHLISKDQSNAALGPYIVLSTETTPNGAADYWWMHGPIYGTTPVGATSPQLLYDTGLARYYSQWMQRFTPPTSGTRYITQIGLTNLSSSGPLPVNAYVTLTTPCSQTFEELLDVTYRIQWIADAGSTVGQSLATGDIGTTAYFLTHGSLSALTHDAFSSPFPLKYLPSEGKYTNIYYAYQHNNYATDWMTMTNIPAVGALSTKTITNNSYIDNATTELNGPAKKLVTINANTTNLIGRLIASEMYQIQSYQVTSWKNVTTPSGTAIQPIHSHAAATFSAAAPTPFLDPTPATGTGKLIGGGTWTNPDLPEHYMIKMTAGGAVGTAMYQFWKRNTVGYAGIVYTSRSEMIPTTAATVNLDAVDPFTSAPIKGTHGFFVKPHQQSTFNADRAYKRVCRINKAKFATADNTGVTLFNIANNDYVNLDAASTPALPVTAVRQVSVDEATGTVWVACADTGLWKITGFGTSVTHITAALNGVPSDNCYGVDIGRLGNIWAVFNGGVSVSTDQGTSWTTYNSGTLPAFTLTGITDGNWNSINYMKVDPQHADDRMVFVRRPDTGVLPTMAYAWWSRGTGTATGVTLATTVGNQNARASTQGIDVSDTDGMWIMSGAYTTASPIYMLTFGSSVNNVVGPASQTYSFCPFFFFEKGPSGETCVGLIENKASYTTVVSLYNAARTLVTQVSHNAGYYNVLSSNNSGYIVYMGGGAFMTHAFAASTGTTVYMNHSVGTLMDTQNTFVGNCKQIIWEKYGWNGTAWELNHVGSKPTHATDEPLINGITMRFQNGVSGTSFVQDEYYTFGVCNGILKDNSISYISNTTAHIYPSKTSTNFGGTVAAAPSTGTVTWRHKSSMLTVNPDQSLVNTYDNRTYGLYAISNNRLFGDFSITGTAIQGQNRDIQVGLTALKGCPIHDHYMWSYSNYTGQLSSEYAFSIYSNTIQNYRGFTSNSIANILAGGSTWTLSRVGNTITLVVDGVTRASVTTSTEHSFVIRVLYTYNSSTGNVNAQHTLPPMTVTSSGTGYVVPLGSIGTSDGRYDPNFLFAESDPKAMNVSMNGTPVAVKLSNVKTAPAPGEVVIASMHGDLICNAADVGKTITGSFIYSAK